MKERNKERIIQIRSTICDIHIDSEDFHHRIFEYFIHEFKQKIKNYFSEDNLAYFINIIRIFNSNRFIFLDIIISIQQLFEIISKNFFFFSFLFFCEVFDQ
jgi:hypothetical protein